MMLGDIGQLVIWVADSLSRGGFGFQLRLSLCCGSGEQAAFIAV